MKSLETKSTKANPIDDGLPPTATFSKLFKGDRTEPRDATRHAIANVLGVSRQWLDHGVGEPPILVGPYEPMPKNAELDKHDPSHWARNFAKAVLTLGAMLEADVIEKLAEEAKGRENDLQPVGWIQKLSAAQPATPPKLPPKPEAKPAPVPLRKRA